MSKAFGHDFVLVNDVRQLLPVGTFTGGPWVHLATVKRGFKEYMAFNKLGGRQAFIEEVDPKEPGLLKKITDDAEWADIYRFLTEQGCFFVASSDHEIKGGAHGVPGLVGDKLSG